jgi:hypothetical protein
MVYLALRKTDSSGFLKGLFSKYTRWRLKTQYPHCGIVIDGQLCHSTFQNNLHWSAYIPAEYDLFETNIFDKTVLERYEFVKTNKYDYLGLLSFLLPFKLGEKNSLYCYEWAWFALTGNLPEQKITPEILLVQIWLKKIPGIGL